MNNFQETKLIHANMEKLFDVVKNVDVYQEFLPWIKNSSTCDHGEGFFTGKLVLSYQNIEQAYQSRVIYKKNHDNCYVKAFALDGPFKKLQTNWALTAIDQDKTNVCFTIDFEFSNILYQKIFQHFFSDVSKNIIQAFEKRLHEI